jgi:hypothetical protein
MVGGTSFHRTIHAASLGRNAGKKKILSGKKENASPATRTVEVSLDRADAFIEGGPETPLFPSSHRESRKEYHCATSRGRMAGGPGIVMN